eukprot:10369483-Karenia_brevis.AAC.1
MQQHLPDRFFVIDHAGHASPVLLDGDCAAGVDVTSFNAANSACEKGTANPPYPPQGVAPKLAAM